MGKYWDWYEVEFDRAARKLDPERKSEILDSLREHVMDSAAELRDKQFSDEEAEKIAVRNLGAPSDLVRSELETSRWQWLPVWLGGIGVTWCATWLIAFSPQWTISMILPALYLTPVAVFLATLTSRKTKLWAMGGVISAIGFVALVVVSLTWVDLGPNGGVTPRWSLEFAIQESAAQMRIAKSSAEDLSMAGAAFKNNDRSLAKTLVFNPELGWKAPTGFWKDHYRVEYQYLPSFEAAQKAWVSRHPRILSGLHQRMTKLGGIQAAVYSNSHPRRILAENLAPFTAVTLGVFAVLSLCHMLALGLLRIPGHFARRRWRVAL